MPAPRPLTLCPPAKLDWSRPGTPAASDFGDIYFSTDGGLDETRTVFLQGCGIPDVWQNTGRFVIGELGFGSGLNFLATWEMWNQTKPQNGHLHFVSVEKHPFSKAQLEKALSAWPTLKPYADKLTRVWPDRVRGFHRLHFSDVTLTLIHDDIENALNELEMKANAWFLDGFSPLKNPDMWTPDIMKKLRLLSAPGARLATFTVAGTVRQALKEAGFMIERKEGFGQKRHRLEAHFTGTAPKFSYQTSTPPQIIGAGIGGLSIAQAFLRRGVEPKIFEDPNYIAASGNPAALVKPRLDLQDRPESRFFLSSYLYTQQSYEDVTLSTGIRHLAKNEKEIERHKKFLEQRPLPEEHLTEFKKNHLLFPKALVIDPTAYRKSLETKLYIESKKLDAIDNQATPLFVAAGFGIRSLLPDWPMRFSRGQISWGETPSELDCAVSYGGYAIPLNKAALIGATHDRLTKSNPFEVKSSDDKKNLEQFENYISSIRPASNKASRASVRVTSSDTLPVIGQASDGHFVLTGLGSRGFVFAPLLAEAIVSKFYGDPMPIAKSVWQRFLVTRLMN